MSHELCVLQSSEIEICPVVASQCEQNRANMSTTHHGQSMERNGPCGENFNSFNIMTKAQHCICDPPHSYYQKFREACFVHKFQ
mmetsp:Transcript_122670/g.192528  ORF Transcript_122670/g.192528 Transcript_122670/m.192528 type:complete len:84 (-) Transcript_122670:679-930(-)